MGLILRTAVLTDLGRRRANNEDAAYAGRRLLAVADGMGGLPAGEMASELAIRALAGVDPPAGADQVGHVGDDDLVAALRAGFEEASTRIRAAAAEDAVRDGMGTTVTALLFGSDRVALMHIGDSRGYLLRDGVLTQLTKDDTFVQALVDQGVLTAQDARSHPQRSLVTKAMQGQSVAPYGATLPVRPGDLYLLCSDGLSDVVTDDEIANLLRTATSLDDCASRLVTAAVDGGGPDNVTVLLAHVDLT